MRSRLTTATETKTIGIGDVRSVLIVVAKVSLVFESITAALLTGRFVIGYDEPFGHAFHLGVFHAVSAFNNAGFGLYADNLVRFVADPWINLPIAGAIIAGGLGFPVLFELRRPSRWSVHTKITLSLTAILLTLGTVFVAASEWRNARRLGAANTASRRLLRVGERPNRRIQYVGRGGA